MTGIPDITPLLAPGAALGIVVSLTMRMIKAKITDKLARWASAVALSAVLGAGWTIYNVVVAGEPWSFSVLVTNAGAVWASSLAVWATVKPMLQKAGK